MQLVNDVQWLQKLIIFKANSFFAMMCCANMLSAVAYTCPSVCLFMSYCVKMAKLRIMQTTQYKTPGKQTFCCGD